MQTPQRSKLVRLFVAAIVSASLVVVARVLRKAMDDAEHRTRVVPPKQMEMQT